MAYHRDEGAPLPSGCLLRKRYRIGPVLGRGENGVTYEAVDTLSGGTVAIKEFFPKRLCVRAEGTSTLSPRDRESGTQFFLGSEAFLSQHDALTQAAGSASVVSVYEAFFENGTSYAVMERLRGITLLEYTARIKRRLRPGEAVTLLTALSGALLVVHSLNMLHGSIAPENVFISEGGAVKLIDFGAARETLKLHRAVDNEQGMRKDGRGPVGHFTGPEKGIGGDVHLRNLPGDPDGKPVAQGKTGQDADAALPGRGTRPLPVEVRAERGDAVISQNHGSQVSHDCSRG